MIGLWLIVAGAVAAAPAPKPVKPASPPAKLVLKPGQAIAFPASVVDGRVVLGAPRLGEFGKLEAGPGEIAVWLSKRDKDLYDQLVVTEKTAEPIDFLATGMVGEIKIDERVVKGKLDGAITQRIGGTSWTVWLREFEVGK